MYNFFISIYVLNACSTIISTHSNAVMCQDVFKREVEREKPFDFYIYKSRKAHQDDLQAQKNRKKLKRRAC